jgi:hypothetical protein
MSGWAVVAPVAAGALLTIIGVVAHALWGSYAYV